MPGAGMFIRSAVTHSTGLQISVVTLLCASASPHQVCAEESPGPLLVTSCVAALHGRAPWARHTAPLDPCVVALMRHSPARRANNQPGSYLQKGVAQTAGNSLAHRFDRALQGIRYCAVCCCVYCTKTGRFMHANSILHQNLANGITRENPFSFMSQTQWDLT